MARKAAHDQRSTPTDWVCSACRQGSCNQCIDIMRVVVLGKEQLCYCTRKRHSGDPTESVRDPDSGTIWMPGLRVTEDGEVIRMTIADDGTVIERPITADDVPGYQYRNASLDVIWVTSVPKDDEAAVAYFHSIMLFGKGYLPVYVERRIEGSKYKMLPFTFDPDTMTTTAKAH